MCTKYLETVIFLDKREIKPKSIRSWFAEVKNYLTYLDVEVFSEKCKQLIKLPKIRRLKKEALTKELILKSLRNSDTKDSTTVLIALSSGMRVGEIASLTLDDIDFTSEYVRIDIEKRLQRQEKTWSHTSVQMPLRH